MAIYRPGGIFVGSNTELIIIRGNVFGVASAAAMCAEVPFATLGTQALDISIFLDATTSHVQVRSCFSRLTIQRVPQF